MMYTGSEVLKKLKTDLKAWLPAVLTMCANRCDRQSVHAFLLFVIKPVQGS